jgi:predicted PurR-regulated permease PerM
MTTPETATTSTLRKLRPLIILAAVALISVLLRYGGPVLVPLSLAALLTFLFTPVVNALQRWGLGRVLPVVLVLVLMFSVIAVVGYTAVTQITSLGNELPKYRGNIRQKITDLRSARRGSALDRIEKEAREVIGEIKKDTAPAAPDKPVPVVVERDSVWHLPNVLEMFASAGLMVVLVIFMLIRRNDLRNRILRLAGHGRVATATQALDEASTRVSRYLVAQCMINGGFGVVVALGLWLIGLPYAFLWGFLAACLRFIPYVGTWMAAAMPIALSLAVFDGWQKPLLVVGLFVVIEPLIYMVLEPLLYGQSAGVSEVALLVAVAYWTWVWGPVGLVLATPLTVCLVVFAKYVPDLDFIVVLMADEPVLDSNVSFYQRLLAGDPDEAMELVDRTVAEGTRDDVYDALLMPALGFMRRDRAEGRIGEDDEAAILRSVREVVDDLAQDAPPPEPSGGVPCVVGCPAQDRGDALALTMLRALMAGRCDVTIVDADLLIAEVAAAVEESGAPVVCVAALPPIGLSRARYLVKRIRSRCPEVRILVGRWGFELDSREVELLRSAGADAVHGSIVATRDALLEILSLPREMEPTRSVA